MLFHRNFTVYFSLDAIKICKADSFMVSWLQPHNLGISMRTAFYDLFNKSWTTSLSISDFYDG